MDWGTWTQNTLGSVINLAAQNEYVLQPQVEAAKWQALGEAGYYREGQPGTTAQPAGLNISGNALLLIGAAVVVVMMLKD